MFYNLDDYVTGYDVYNEHKHHIYTFYPSFPIDLGNYTANELKKFINELKQKLCDKKLLCTEN